ncbi:hypothetical protein D1872_271220 [compost metagenome]
MHAGLEGDIECRPRKHTGICVTEIVMLFGRRSEGVDPTVSQNFNGFDACSKLRMGFARFGMRGYGEEFSISIEKCRTDGWIGIGECLITPGRIECELHVEGVADCHYHSK